MDFNLGDTIRLKKKHPCGGYEWQVVRVGADIAIRCLTCKRRIILLRSELEKIVKQ